VLLAKDVLCFQHFPPDRQIIYKNKLKSQLDANISIGQLFNGIFVGLVQKDSIVIEYGNKKVLLYITLRNHAPFLYNPFKMRT
jgi:hypothetical protein